MGFCEALEESWEAEIDTGDLSFYHWWPLSFYYCYHYLLPIDYFDINTANRQIFIKACPPLGHYTNHTNPKYHSGTGTTVQSGTGRVLRRYCVVFSWEEESEERPISYQDITDTQRDWPVEMGRIELYNHLYQNLERLIQMWPMWAMSQVCTLKRYMTQVRQQVSHPST